MRRTLVNLVAGAGDRVAGSPALAAHRDHAGQARTDKGSTEAVPGEARTARAKRIATFSGHNAGKSQIRSEPLEKPSGKHFDQGRELGRRASPVNDL